MNVIFVYLIHKFVIIYKHTLIFKTKHKHEITLIKNCLVLCYKFFQAKSMTILQFIEVVNKISQTQMKEHFSPECNFDFKFDFCHLIRPILVIFLTKTAVHFDNTVMTLLITTLLIMTILITPNMGDINFNDMIYY
jgi:hypothetical protein